MEICQDVNGYVAELDQGSSVVHQLPTGRHAYLLCIEGGVTVNGQRLGRHDACEITDGEGAVEITATDVEETVRGDVAHFLMYEIPAIEGSGRSDL